MSDPTGLQIADAIMRAHSVQVGSLRRGRLFLIAGERYRLLYANPCRAHVEAVRGESVVIKGRKFHRKRYLDISPGTVVQIREQAVRSGE